MIVSAEVEIDKHRLPHRAFSFKTSGAVAECWLPDAIVAEGPRSHRAQADGSIDGSD